MKEGNRTIAPGRRSTTKHAEILEISRKIHSERDLPALLQLTAREAAKLVAASRVSLFILDRENAELWSLISQDSPPIRFDARLGIAGAAALGRETINVVDAHEDPRFYWEIDSRTHYRTRSLMAVPIVNAAGEVLGVLEALNKKSDRFTSEDEGLLKSLAVQAANAIQTAQLVGALKEREAQLTKENRFLWREVEGRFSTRNLIGFSPKIQAVVRLIEEIRDSTVDVLISGESGTGKELVAKALHYNSPRARGPFIALNCAALPETLIESELFGIEKGVATGVDRNVGKFEEARGGTLFLDEIGDLDLKAQAKILRVLQERALQRVGGRTQITIDVRIIAATNKNLEAAIQEGAFRADLYYRLRVVSIETPPLRESPQDIPVLAQFFLEKYCKEMGKEPKRFTSEALRWLSWYDWPGNVRQLENEIKRIVASVRRTVITVDDLNDGIRLRGNRGTRSADGTKSFFHAAVAELEQRLILEALQSCQFNQRQAAKVLGLSRQGLIKKIKRYDIRTAT